MKKLLIFLVFTVFFLVTSFAQTNVFWAQTEAHAFGESRTMYGVGFYEHYLPSGLGFWAQTVFSPEWSKLVGGVSYSRYQKDVAFIELAGGLGYETNLRRPRVASYVFGSLHLDGDESNRTGQLTVLYNPEYGHSFYHFGFALYNITEYIQVGAMLQPDGVTGPRLQGNFGANGSIRPWCAVGYSTLYKSWGVSIGLRYKLGW